MPIKLLSFQESVSTGERLVYSRTSTKFRWPGRFTDTGEANKIKDYTINLLASVNPKGSSDLTYCNFALYDNTAEAANADIQVNLSGRSRTNVI